MRVIIDWLRSWWYGARIHRELAKGQRKLEALQRECEDERAKLEGLVSQSTDLLDRMRAELDLVRASHVRYESALEETREKNKVLEQTIETLVASHRLLLARYDAEIAVQSRLRAAATIRSE